MIDINARWIAYQILNRLEAKHSNSTILLQENLVKVPNPKDRHLITDLVLGTLRWRNRLLFFIENFSRRPVHQVDREILLILQLGVYQLLYTNIPPHAAVYETVRLCRIARLTSASSFVNGILRGIQGRMESLPEPTQNVLPIRWSHPEWLVNRWVKRFGEAEAIALMQTNNQPPPVYLQVNPLITEADSLIKQLASEEVVTEPTHFGKSVLRVREGSAHATKSFLDGAFYIQDAAVHLLGEFMSPTGGTRVLEIAAAPGGKTFQLATRLNDRGSIIAVDSGLRRMRTWKRNIERLKISSASGLVADARCLPICGEFDQVILDAPCSTLGVIRRHPEIKWWRQEEDLASIAQLQLDILNACLKYVRAEGELIYTLCSFEPEETEQVRDAFLEQNQQFTKTGEVFLLPHRDHTDGFYGVKLQLLP
jgi:16S rRNA (cytosine967-C5)-methyltransferase